MLLTALLEWLFLWLPAASGREGIVPGPVELEFLLRQVSWALRAKRAPATGLLQRNLVARPGVQVNQSMPCLQCNFVLVVMLPHLAQRILQHLQSI